MAEKLTSPTRNYPGNLAAQIQSLRTFVSNKIRARILLDMIPIYPEQPLLAEEEFQVRNAVASRRAEFAAGRHCARQLLSTWGHHNIAILARPKGESLWADSIVGSISHDQGKALAAISVDEHLTGFGVDILGCDHTIDSSSDYLIASKIELASVTQMLRKYRQSGLVNKTINPLMRN